MALDISRKGNGETLETLLKSTDSQFRATRFWLDIASKFEQRVPKKRHWRNFKTYSDCFVCSKAISLLTKQIKSIRPDADRKKAIWLMQSFQDFGLIEDVRGSNHNRRIADDSRLLRFVVPGDASQYSGEIEDGGPSSWNSADRCDLESFEDDSPKCRKRKLCSQMVFHYICRHFELTSGVGLNGESERTSFFEQLSKETAHAYDNIAVDLQLCDKMQTLPDWLVDVMTQLSQWPTPFEKTYQIFLPNMLEMILEYVKEANSFGLRHLLLLFDKITTTAEHRDHVDDSNDTHSASCGALSTPSSCAQQAGGGPCVTEKKVEHRVSLRENEDRRLLTSHLQHVTLLLKPGDRANLAYFICLLQKMDKNEILSAKFHYIHWITELQHVLIGDSSLHERLFSVLRSDLQSSVKVPRILAGLYCNTEEPKNSRRANSFVSRLKSNIGASRFSLDRRRKSGSLLNFQ